jgi:hypothetical protein
MKITKKSGKITITNLKQKEVIGMLKCQMPFDIIFTDLEGAIVPELIIQLGERLVADNKQKVWVGSDSIGYDEIIKQISINLSDGLLLGFMFDLNTFTENKPLIAIAGSLKDTVVESSIFISYAKGVFLVCNRPFKNGDSDKLYFYEDNNSILAFVEDGPVLISGNPNINSVEDVLCN